MSAANPYVGAYPLLRERRGVWREIVRYVTRDLGPVETLVELGAGYCDFANAFPARRKIAYDLNPEMAVHAGADVEMRIADAVALPGLADASVDLFFASNFLEHLDESQLDRLLPRIRACLAPGGRLVLIQPNHRLCAERYFDDPTHCTIFDDHSIATRLAAAGLRPLRVVPGLLPFSMKSRLPKWPILVWLYLRSPLRLGGAQMYVVAERA